MSDVSVIIVTYNSADVVMNAINSVIEDVNVSHCFIVDNSENDSVKNIVNDIQSDKIIYLKNQSNLGFGIANNIALEQVKTPYALLLNPDAILGDDCLSRLLEKSRQYQDAAILAPLLYHENGKIQESYRKNALSKFLKKAKYIEPSGDLCAEFLSGAVLLLKMEHMQKIGFFDRNLFLFYEDDDLCLRAWNARYGVIQVTSAKAVHLVGASVPASAEIDYIKQYHMWWSRLYMEKKYNGACKTRLLILRLFIILCLKISLSILTFRAKKIHRYRARIHGVINFARGVSSFGRK